MRYDHLPAFEKYLETAQPLAPFYFIFGKEPFECQEAVDRLLSALLPPHAQKELSLTPLDGSQLEVPELEQAFHSFSFFSNVRVIWIQHADKLKKTVQERLMHYFHHPFAGQYLLLTAPTWQKNTSFYHAAEKEGVVLDFAELKPWEKEKRLAEWVNKHVSAQRKMMSYSVCQFLVKRMGHDHLLLSQELDKLMCYTAERKEITQQDVEVLCHCQNVDSIWRLGEAIFCREGREALTLFDALLRDGEPLLPLLRQLRSQFQTGYQISLLLAQGKQPQDISAEFPYLKGQLLDKQLRVVKQYGDAPAFKRGLLALDEAELRAKNSLDERVIQELLTVKLVRNE